ncbi:hypothetical protein [Paraburkholderia humisilvae]|uniref:Uncharacterized protein n=1 Tax=Paraburkholderia humisilvae TaxID=627669 RepID=A0A6J5DKW8_9BURK|nr:hypothetical protein [Paraburkholderia humisilvae]CAB3754829.1 hypothetical protein LMG29542_02464 [Paraburkholderia humisilvae]
MVKRTFESGLWIGGGLGASTVTMCEGFKLAMGFGLVAIVAGLAAIAFVSRPSGQRG